MEKQTKTDFLRREAMRCEYEIAKLKSELSKKHFEVAKVSERRMKAIAENSTISPNTAKPVRQYNAAQATVTLKKIENEIHKIELEMVKHSSVLDSIREKLNSQLKKTEAISEAKERSRLEELTQRSELANFNSYEPSDETYDYTPNDGAFHIVTGVNGTGKSRYLRKLVDPPR